MKLSLILIFPSLLGKWKTVLNKNNIFEGKFKDFTKGFDCLSYELIAAKTKCAIALDYQQWNTEMLISSWGS